MKIGYARVSTEAQSLDIQLQALRKDGCEKLLQEKVSGAVRARPQLQRLLDQLREGDTVVVCKLDRLARSTQTSLPSRKRSSKRAPVSDRANHGQIPPRLPARWCSPCSPALGNSSGR